MVLHWHGKRPMVLHWHGKLMKDLTGDEKVDRHPTSASGSGIDQLHSVPKLPSGTDKIIADVIVEVVFNVQIKNRFNASAWIQHQHWSEEWHVYFSGDSVRKKRSYTCHASTTFCRRHAGGRF